MRSYAFILCFVSLRFITNAQFTFTAANSNPVAGDNYIEYPADTTSINPGPSGANQTWDFQNLNINTGSPLSHVFINPIFGTGCTANLFPTANIEDSVTQTYFYTDNNRLSLLGFNTYGRVYKNDTSFIYPLAYGSSYTNSSNSNCHCNCIAESGNNQLIKTYDGYGTLMLPGITFSNVARVVDFVEYFNNYGQAKYTSGFLYKYTWYENNIKFPVLTISIQADSSHNPFTGVWHDNPVRKSVTVQNYTGVGVSNTNTNHGDLVIYPNPTDGEIILNSTITIKEIFIYNGVGDKIFSRKSKDENNEIDLSDQPNGIYCVQILTEEGSISKKIVISR